MTQRTVRLGSVPVGDGNPPAFVAEIGSFFKQDMVRALDFLERAVAAGAPIFKTEILHSPDVVMPATGLKHKFSHAQGSRTQDYRALIEERVVPLERYRTLLERCHALDTPFIASVFDRKGIEFLVDVKAAGIKISRNYINHHVLIRCAAETGLPVLLDVGEVYFSETLAAVEIVRRAGTPVIVLHHPGPNPSPAAIHNMRLIETYKCAIGAPIGLSDHYRGDLMIYVAAALGANIIEKGVVDDPDAPESDVVSAARFSELPDILRKLKAVWESLGDGGDHTKMDRNLSGRAGTVARRRLACGHKLSIEDVEFAWPPLGITSDHWPLIAGAHLAREVAAGAAVTWADLGLVHNAR